MGNWISKSRFRRHRCSTIAAVVCVSLAPATVLQGTSGRSPIDFLVDGATSRVECVDVSVEHTGIFFVPGVDSDDMYGFADDAQLTWTFSTGIYEFDFLTWAHGDIGDPVTQYERFTVEALNSHGTVVDSLIVEDRDQEYGDFEYFEMNFDRRVLSIRMTFVAQYPPGDASSALIPYLRSRAGCVDPDFDEYHEGLAARSSLGGPQGLPDTR